MLSEDVSTMAVDGEEVDADRNYNDGDYDWHQDIYPAGHQQLLYTIIISP